MRGAREGLRAAAERFSIAARKADQSRDYASLRDLNWAIADITAACTSCHGHYRVR
jgi:cytochrome c556